MTSQWAQWCLKSPASRLFTLPLIQGADQRKHQSSTSLAFARGIHRWPVNSPHKRPVTRKMFPFDDVIMEPCFARVIFIVISSPMFSRVVYDDVIKWKLFPRYWLFVRGIHRSPVDCPHKGYWRGALKFSLIFSLWRHCNVNRVHTYRNILRNTVYNLGPLSLYGHTKVLREDDTYVTPSLIGLDLITELFNRLSSLGSLDTQVTPL